MGAFNWIVLDSDCPSCGEVNSLLAQAHVASSFCGDERGRFCNRTYKLGERMVWWNAGHPNYADLPEDRGF